MLQRVLHLSQIYLILQHHSLSYTRSEIALACRCPYCKKEEPEAKVSQGLLLMVTMCFTW